MGWSGKRCYARGPGPQTTNQVGLNYFTFFFKDIFPWLDPIWSGESEKREDLWSLPSSRGSSPILWKLDAFSSLGTSQGGCFNAVLVMTLWVFSRYWASVSDVSKKWKLMFTPIPDSIPPFAPSLRFAAYPVFLACALIKINPLHLPEEALSVLY